MEHVRMDIQYEVSQVSARTLAREILDTEQAIIDALFPHGIVLRYDNDAQSCFILESLNPATELVYETQSIENTGKLEITVLAEATALKGKFPDVETLNKYILPVGVCVQHIQKF